MHGYEMIKEIEERSKGAWTPSAGSIYPTLQMLEDEGVIKGEEVEGKRRFTLTEEGAAARQEKAGEEAPWDAVRADAGVAQAELRDSTQKLHHAISQAFRAADDPQRQRVAELLDRTRREVYAILAEGD
jgi:DNA-binding PadR family transcriptional regulator